MRKGKKTIVITILLAMMLSLFGEGFYVYAENFQNPAPYLMPTVSNGKRILFDNTHGQTAGEADWVIDGAFSDYAQGLVGEGYFVKELRKEGAISYSDLKDYDVFIIPEANIPFKVSEQDAIEEYVREGGSVFFISDHYNADRNKNRWDASEVFNGYRRGAFKNPTLGMIKEEATSNAMLGVESRDWLAETFGVRFRYNGVGDVNANLIKNGAECFGITNGVKSVAMHGGSTIAIVDPKVAKGIVYLPEKISTTNKWPHAVDEGIYNGGGIAEGAYVAIVKKDKGKVALIGDSSPVEDASPKYKKEENGQTKRTYDGYKEQDDKMLLLQLSNWLATQEDYTDFTQTGSLLDKETVIDDTEIPELSTEPQPEPWAQPTSGYKWYDESTFASGSYGFIDEKINLPIKEAEYQLYVPNPIRNGVEIPLIVYITGQKANTIISNVKVGAYLNGGTQIGLFKEIGYLWPDTYGYSNPFSITTDENGNGIKPMIFKINQAVTGSANIRLKIGSKNVYTESIAITE